MQDDGFISQYHVVLPVIVIEHHTDQIRKYTDQFRGQIFKMVFLSDEHHLALTGFPAAAQKNVPEPFCQPGSQLFPNILEQFIQPFILYQTRIRIHDGVGIRAVKPGDDLPFACDLHRKLCLVAVVVRIFHAQCIPDLDSRKFTAHPVCFPGQLTLILQVLQGTAAAFAEHRTQSLCPFRTVAQAFHDPADGKTLFRQDHPDPGFFLRQKSRDKHHFTIVPQHTISLVGEIGALSGEFFVSFHGLIIDFRHHD